MTIKRNTEAIVRLAAQKSQKSRQRVLDAIQTLQQRGETVNVSTICRTARVSKPFLYDEKHADLLEKIRQLGEVPPPKPPATETLKTKSDSAKDTQIARLKERLQSCEQKLQQCKLENSVLYGKLASQDKDSRQEVLKAELEKLCNLREQNNQRIEKLETENLGLRNLLRDVYGLSNLQLVETIDLQRQEIEQLSARNKELKAQLVGVEAMKAENEELRKEKQRLFNRITQLQAAERSKAAKSFAKARRGSANLPNIPDVEF